MDLQLTRGELLTLEPGRTGVRIRCRSGRLWVTQAGDPRDHLLGAGQELLLTRRGRVVITALAESLCLPEAPGRRALPALQVSAVRT